MRSTAGRARPDHGMMQVGGSHVASFEQRDETQPRYDRAIISYLTAEESDALLAAPDRPPGTAAATTPCSSSTAKPDCVCPN